MEKHEKRRKGCLKQHQNFDGLQVARGESLVARKREEQA